MIIVEYKATLYTHTARNMKSCPSAPARPIVVRCQIMIGCRMVNCTNVLISPLNTTAALKIMFDLE